MAENEPNTGEQKLVDTETLFAELNELAGFQRRTMATMRKLFGEDQAGFIRVARVLDGTHPDDTGAMVDLQVALDQCLLERDHARAAVHRFEALGNRYAAAVVRGVA